jgi:phage anti-repressor protein
MKELIPVTKQPINEVEALTCDARALHVFMESKQHFADWIKNRIEKYGFTEGVDFIVFHNSMKNPDGGRPSQEYSLTLDMAKQLGMVENNAKGMELRRYFIKCEQLAKKAAQRKPAVKATSSDAITARSLAISLRLLSRMKVYPEEMRAVFAARAVTALTGEPLHPLLPTIQDNRDTWLTPTAIAGRLNISANSVGRLLKKLGLHGDGGHRARTQPAGMG